MDTLGSRLMSRKGLIDGKQRVNPEAVIQRTQLGFSKRPKILLKIEERCLSRQRGSSGEKWFWWLWTQGMMWQRHWPDESVGPPACAMMKTTQPLAQSTSPKYNTSGNDNNAAYNESPALSQQTAEQYPNIFLFVMFLLLKVWDTTQKYGIQRVYQYLQDSAQDK